MSQYFFEHYWSEEAQLEIKRKIAALLNDKNLILVTGAGFSNNFGYPRWKEFLDEMKLKCHVAVDENTYKIDGTLDYLRYAQAIFDKSSKNDFNNFISERFDQTKCIKPIKDFYSTLISMGFCGFVTLNYDHTLEILIGNFLPGTRPDPIDFCGPDREIKIRKFLNNASKKEEEYRYVLHLHGVYDAPSKVILTQNSYERSYLNGSITELIELVKNLQKDLADKPALFGKVYEMERRIEMMYSDNILQSLHKKIIWTLFARYRIIFIGFSTDDIFFMNLLNVVVDDFMLPSNPEHYVLTSYRQTGTPEENQEKDNICKKMIDRGVLPIFYPVTDSNYEKGLRDFILEIESLKATKEKTYAVKPASSKTTLDKTIDGITAFTMGLK